MSKPTLLSRPDGVQLLAWDSDFLGFPVARFAAQYLSPTSLATLTTQCRAAGIRLVYLVADPLDQETAAAVRQAGIRLADRKVTFAKKINLPGAASALNPAANRIARATEFTPQLEQLAWQSGEFSRFRLDEQFGAHVFKDLYSRWLQAALAGDRAETVWASVSPAGHEQGLLTLERYADYASIGLLAVDEDARGLGIGRQLVETAQRQAQQWGSQELRVVTQRDNERACRFYAHCGFALVHEAHIYHLWL